MSLWTWLGFSNESEVKWLRQRIENLEQVNLELRRENMAMSNANTMAQIEAYRQAERDRSLERRQHANLPMSEDDEAPLITDNVFIGDHLADGVVPEGMEPTDQQLIETTQRDYREKARRRGTPAETPAPESDDDDPAGEATIG